MFGSAAESTFAVPHQPEYEHTQWAPMCWIILLPPLAILLLAGILSGGDVVVPFFLVGLLLTVIAFSFRSLRVVDEGDALAIRFGPIPLFRKRIPYADIQAAERDRSSVIDGWGIHWVPGRGWTYNLWGFDCVRLALTGGSTIRVGTDDPDGLASFLERKSSSREN
jgi:hypothetical protein